MDNNKTCTGTAYTGKAYTGIDYFRCVAAFLVIAIHTSIFTTYSKQFDMMATRIIARIAVPFFFATTGFFLSPSYSKDNSRLAKLVKKMSVIYAFSIIIYIPINIYNGYFSTEYLLPNIIKDIVFDGTMYHLWYFPAVIIGATIVWFLTKKFGIKRTFAVTLFLYAVGIFGDSLYGVSQKIPFAECFYRHIFEVSDYTRNGIFFAPVFITVGAIISDRSVSISALKCAAGFVISFIFMLAEGIIVHRAGLVRHDSMYIFLIPCTYYLFSLLTFWRGERKASLRTFSLVVYIIHPLMIVAVRLLAKLTGTQEIFIENSIGHYFAVSVFSAVFSLIFTLLCQKVKRRKIKSAAAPADDMLTARGQRAWLEINQDNLKHNVQTLKNAMPEKCELMVVVKAQAYGHGMYETAVCLNKIGVKAFAVATIDEGIELRRYGIRGEILILGYTDVRRAKELRRYQLTQTLISYKYASLLDSQGISINAHIKIDTGMHRLGIDYREAGDIEKIFKLKHIHISGIYSHLCVSDSLNAENIAFTQKQISNFRQAIDRIGKSGFALPKIHIQSSYGLLNYPELKFDYVRAGIALYGVLSSPDDKVRKPLDLRPVLSLKTKVILIRTVEKGETIGYGRAFTASRKTKIAILPIGYADGIPRSLSCGKGYAIINGKRAYIAGRVCMDQTAVDITDIPNVAEGTTATIIGDGIPAPTVADNAGSISNELLSRIGSRVEILKK